MSLFQRHIQSRNKITEVSYAILQKPTTTAIISEEIMETNEEKKDIRQTSQVIHDESRLADNKKAEGQEEAKSISKVVEGKPIGLLT